MCMCVGVCGCVECGGSVCVLGSVECVCVGGGSVECVCGVRVWSACVECVCGGRSVCVWEGGVCVCGGVHVCRTGECVEGGRVSVCVCTCVHVCVWGEGGGGVQCTHTAPNSVRMLRITLVFTTGKP